MTAFSESFELAHQRRQERRSRMLRTIRGWLRAARSPRLTLALIVLACAAFAAVASFGMRRAGLELSGLRWAYAVGASWPLFLLLLYWRAGAEFRRFDMTSDAQVFVRFDERVEFELATSSARPSSARWHFDEEIQQVLAREAGKAAGKGGLLPMAFLIVITVGGWLVWDLIQLGPTLLTQSILDGWLLPAHPSLAANVHSQRWLAETAAYTGLHFLALGLVAFLAGLFFPPFFAPPF